MKKIDQEICQALIDYMKIYREKRKTGVTITHELVETICSILQQDADIKKNTTPQELREDTSLFLQRSIGFYENNADTLKQETIKFIEDFKEIREYRAVFLLNGVRGLPKNTKFGSMRIIELPNDEMVISHVNTILVDSASADRSDWAEIIFSTYRNRDFLNDVFIKELEKPLSFVSLLLNHSFDPRQIVGIIYHQNGSRTFIGFEKEYFTSYIDKLHKIFLNFLSEISCKKNPSKLEKKILRGIELYGISNLTKNHDIRFIMLTSALETLLLSKNDKDYLGLKLAEKSSYLIENDGEKQLNLFRLVKEMYGKRSGLIHEGNRKIEERDVDLLEDLVGMIIFRLLKLSSKYPQMEYSDKPTQLGIENLIEEIKYNLKRDRSDS